MGFPGEIAGASLKQLRVRRQRAEAAGGFPGEIAGASLKRVDLDGETIAQQVIPRRNRRGLIEASIRRREGITRAIRFPGEIAGASLKRDLRVEGHHERGLDSPAKSPGPH